MKLKSVRIKNFKAIEDCDIPLTDATVLVGPNNAGKSSLLQAIHFASRTLAMASEANKQSTLSLSGIEYIPSLMYRELAHGAVWGNATGSPESTVEFRFFDADDKNDVVATVVLKAARNEGISVNPTLPQKAIPLFRAKDAVFSTYIPGISGIPLQEEVISKRHTFRKAASGDSNVVLRNILLLIQAQNKFDDLLDNIQDIYPGVKITVEFDQETDYSIRSQIKFANSSVSKPLEYAGTGFLQVLQIFSYLVLFRPQIILIDEPESHLHPTLQTKLVRRLQKRVSQTGAVALITTHSPFVARGLPLGSRTIWVNAGKVQATSDDQVIREALGWGALDKPILLCTEDSSQSHLNAIISQRESLLDKVSVFPFEGVSKLGSATLLKTLRAKLGGNHQIIVHRDRDCRTKEELERWQQEYKNVGIKTWITAGSDIESYYCNQDHIAAVLNISLEEGRGILEETINDLQDSHKNKFTGKRREINKMYEKSGGSPNTDTLWDELPFDQKYLGKDLLSQIRDNATKKGYNEKKIGRPGGDFLVAEDLIKLVEEVVKSVE